MKKWALQYSKKIEKWLTKLPKQKYLSLARDLELLALSGNVLLMPHSKNLGAGLHELRERNFGLRVYYTFVENQLILLVAAGDKSSQQRDIKQAYKILKKIGRGESHGV